ncbi:hypothetical protein BH23ACT6_BH23ACT6_10100 [soil metagenome]
MTHGYANMVAHTTLQRREATDVPVDLIEARYADREQMRPIYGAVLALVSAFGDDMEIAPKKASVSLRCAKQFALVEPATKSRVDSGINLASAEPTDRRKAAKGMCTHKVDVDQIDGEVAAWLRRAYEAAVPRS